MAVRALFFSALLVASSFGLARAADTTLDGQRPVTDAERLTLQALSSEAQGELVQRDQLLSEATKLDNDCSLARWQQGLLKDGDGKWRSIDEIVSAKDSLSNLARYEAERELHPDTAAGHWQMGVWCVRNLMIDQARAHLENVLESEPDHVGARQLLGYQRVGGQWVSSMQWRLFQERSAEVTAAIQKYGTQLTAIAKGFRTREAKARQAARDQLMEIKDVDAIAPVEAVIGTVSAQSATAVLDWLVTFDDPEATMSMARFGLLHNQPTVRAAAVAHIKNRPLHDYVPQLLEMLSSPVAAMSVPVMAPNGTLAGFRQAFTQERQGQTDVLFLDTVLQYGEQPTRRGVSANRVAPVQPLVEWVDDPVGRLATAMEAMETSSVRAAQNSAAMQSDNQRILARNRQIATFMSAVTEHEFNGDVAEMWMWWDSKNETERQALKLPKMRYALASLATGNYSERPQSILGGSGSGTQVAGECFAQGTPVMTRKGTRPIESIRLGDIVLSRNVSTGELSWKPVLRATTRPPRPLLEIKLDSDTLRCTTGHLFWVSGKGWSKASELKAGDLLHGASQPTVVMKVDRRPEEQTFNLVVEATNTYFAGEQMVLSHDVTERAPNHLKVPGLTPSATGN